MIPTKLKGLSKDISNKKEPKNSYVRIRITRSVKLWLKRNNLSPTKIWDQTIQQLQKEKITK